MPEISIVAPPPPETRRQLLREALPDAVPGWRPLAENVLGADARIDWVGVDAGGRAVLALVGTDPGEDLALVASGLAQRGWLAARLGDWLQLAPGSGLDPQAGVLALLLAPAFRPAALAAAAALPDLRPALLRFARDDRGGIGALIEPLPGTDPAPAPRSNGSSAFRSGLSAADLDLSPEELAELEA